jgi:hypothetical protein
MATELAFMTTLVLLTLLAAAVLARMFVARWRHRREVPTPALDFAQLRKHVWTFYVQFENDDQGKVHTYERTLESLVSTLAVLYAAWGQVPAAVWTEHGQQRIDIGSDIRELMGVK